MKIRRLATRSDILDFIVSYKIHGKIEFGFDYVGRSEAYVGLDDNGRPNCGFFITSGENMRWPGLIPVQTDFLNSNSKNSMIELNGVWISPELRRKSASIEFWSIISCLLSNRSEKFITFAMDLRKKGLLKVYQPIIFGTVYSGPHKLDSSCPLGVFWSKPFIFSAFRIIYLAEWLKRYLNEPRIFRKTFSKQGLLDPGVMVPALILAFLFAQFGPIGLFRHFLLSTPESSSLFNAGIPDALIISAVSSSIIGRLSDLTFGVIRGLLVAIFSALPVILSPGFTAFEKSLLSISCVLIGMLFANFYSRIGFFSELEKQKSLSQLDTATAEPADQLDRAA